MGQIQCCCCPRKTHDDLDCTIQNLEQLEEGLTTGIRETESQLTTESDPKRRRSLKKKLAQNKVNLKNIQSRKRKCIQLKAKSLESDAPRRSLRKAIPTRKGYKTFEDEF